MKAEQHSDRVYHWLDFNYESTPRFSLPDAPQPFGKDRFNRTPALTESNTFGLRQASPWSGTDPEEVIRKSRVPKEKHDAHDYARRTVTKAQAELRQVTSTQDYGGRIPGIT